MRATEHVGFSDDTGGDGDSVDCGIEFRMRRGHEHFFKATSSGLEDRVKTEFVLKWGVDVVCGGICGGHSHIFIVFFR